MCGIYGILSLREGTSPEAYLLDTMGQIITHRGPDDHGVYVADGIAMGMRRLSIIDLAHGHQPIANEDKTVWVVCNGEIYNFQEVKARLTARGHRFRTGSDVEVVVHLYEEHGPDCVMYLTGMFSFALWDTVRRRLLIARDRLGIKPLYLMREAERLVFASEAKSILALPDISADLNPGAVEEYLSFGYTPNALSIFAGIEKLPPAHILTCERSEITMSEYWQPPAEADTELSDGAWTDQVFAQIDRAVEMEMVSDVPIGTFLSGGIDSSAVTAMMTRHSDHPVKTYSIGFDTGSEGKYYNELPYARHVSKRFGTEHKEIIVRPDVVRLLPMLLWHLDEPIADSAFITTYLVSKFARENVKVILCGVGGDELFGGYRRYLGDHYASRFNRVPSWIRQGLIAPVIRTLPADRHSYLTNLARYARTFIQSSEHPPEDRYRAYVQVFGQDALDRLLRAQRHGHIDSLDTAFAAAVGGDGLNRLMRVDLRTQLPNDLLTLTDRMTMATSLECRVPLLNHQLVELAARQPTGLRIQNGEMKHLLKSALKGLLPDSILHRSKRGFGAPIGAWLKRELSPVLSHILSRQSIERRGLFDWRTVSDTIALHTAEREDHTDHLLSLINFEIWARIYLDKRSPDDLADELTVEAAT